MNEYLIIAHEMEKARLLALRARKRRSSPTGSPPEDLKSTSGEDDGVRALPPAKKRVCGLPSSKK
jgi:hypothetical protein